jgi:hypothetical protein
MLIKPNKRILNGDDRLSNPKEHVCDNPCCCCIHTSDDCDECNDNPNWTIFDFLERDD